MSLTPGIIRSSFARATLFLPDDKGTQSWGGAFIGMRELPFPSVTITTDLGKSKDIESVGVAALWLVAHWPMQTGDKYQAARQACLEAWDEKVTCTACRDAFIEAAKEAGIYITHKRL